ncbi:hypothetical protein [Desulfonatronum thiodismutans]|uniref:hypothetical protein n=1 Tax=Desulfonatronum thiodismutans TaxID=159290 RepID=UPI001268130B|nr:hypothetical protein [Desulfonatronum thiodismutans]
MFKFKGNFWQIAIYFICLALHVVYLFVLLYLAPLDQWNWQSGDTGSYLRPAESFLQEGVFARHGEPDYRRTIGYPLFLAGTLKVAEVTGVEWRIVVYAAQALMFALAYPAIFIIATTLFGMGCRSALACVALTILCGAFVSYVPIILSDALFATTLICGVACGLMALERRSLAWGMAHLALITYAANVRPMLAFFPLAAVCMHWALVKSRGWAEERGVRVLIVFMFVTTLVGVQTPALRNWVNHGVFTPTEIGSINLYDYLAKDVLRMKGQTDRYEETRERIQQLAGAENLEKRIAFRKQEALQVYYEYPLETAGFLSYFTVVNSIEMHWQNFFYLFKQTWHRDYEDGSVLWSPIPFLLAIFFIIFYGNVYLIALLQFLVSRKNIYVFLSIFFFIIPYAFCGTNYQGARFRLWLEPFVLMAFVFQLVNIKEKFLTR